MKPFEDPRERLLEAYVMHPARQARGWRMALYVDPSISFGGKLVGGLRLRALKKGMTAAPVA